MRFGVLGPVIVDAESGPVALTSGKQRLLLAVLLSRAGRPVRADVLIDALWGDDQPANPAAMLRWHVHRLRRLLAEDRILRSDAGYSLVLDRDELDATRFEDLCNRAAHVARSEAAELLHKALDLWRDRAYGELADHAAIREVALRLDELRLTALEKRIEAELALGRHDRLVSELAKLTAEHPMRDRFHVQHLLALYRAGRQADALAAFEALRRRFADELGLTPGSELRELHLAILTNDRRLDLPRDRPVPAELPADVAAFTGREEEMVRLREQLTAGRGPVVISAVTGSGGIGKSALAVHVAHRVAERYPDGQLYLNLHGSTPGTRPLDPQDALARLLRSLGADRIPVGADEAAALYRSLVADRRLIIVLDNAADTEQIQPLLPGSPTCAVLITARSALPLVDKADQHRLGVFTAEESVSLLTRLVGNERIAAEAEAAGRLAELCGHLPLALRIVGARLAARPAWTLARLADRISSESRRMAELSIGDLDLVSTFNISYDELPASQARAFRLCALPDGPDLPLDAAAAVLDVPEAEAEELLDGLADLSLIEAPAHHRYSYHDLLRLHARRHAALTETPDDRAAALHRLLEYYVATIRNASDTMSPGFVWPQSVLIPEHAGQDFSDPGVAWAWLVRHDSHMIKAVGQADRASGRTLALAVTLAYSLVWKRRSGEGRHELRVSTEKLAERAAAQGDGSSEALVRHFLGEFTHAFHDLPAAVPHLERAAELSRELHDRPLLAGVRHAQGNLLKSLRRQREAAAAFEEAARLRHELDDPRIEAVSLGSLARVLDDSGDREAAIAALDRAEAAARRSGHADAIGKVAYERGVLLRRMGSLTEAIESFQTTLRSTHTSGDAASRAYVLYHLAETYRLAGDVDAAIKIAEVCIPLSREAGGEYNAARAQAVLGKAHTARGDHERARMYFEAARDTFARLGAAEAEEIRPVDLGGPGGEA